MPGQHVVDGVDELVDLVRTTGDEIERSRRIPDQVVAALRTAGVNRLFLPAALGGAQASVLEAMDVFERIAVADASTGWCAVIGAGSNLFGGYLPEAAAREVFADADQTNATMFAPRGRVVRDEDGRYRLSGHWPFTSNCLHSAWVGLGALLDGPPPRLVFVPVEALTIEDTWRSAGLQGTGSHDVHADRIDVSLDRSCLFSDQPWPEGTLWRLPLFTVLAPSLSAVPLGIARGALDEAVRQAREGRTAQRGQLADDPVGMADLAAADARLRAARAGLREAVGLAHELAEDGRGVDRELQARIYLACLHACDTGVEVTSIAHALVGSAAVYSGNRVLRALCDVQAARQHLLYSHQHSSELGKALVGLPAFTPPYFTD